MTRIFVIAGEPSGDLLGAALLKGLHQLRPDISFEGVGGPAMADQGLHSLFPMEELSVMGIAEILPRLPNLLRRIRQTADAVIASRPDALITIDSPDFCLRVARRARAALPKLKTIHYVAPSVWAWRPGRAAKMAPTIDHVLALLPFEPPYMRAAGMSCDFVGHPITTEPVATPAEQSALRARFGIGPTQPLLLLLPGSRRGEVTRLGPIFAETGRRLRKTHPDLALLIPAAPPVADLVAATMPPDADGWPRILNDPALKPAAFAAAAAALAASGTVSLELAAAGTPMVIAYGANPVTAFLVKRLARIDTATLVNIITDTRVVPEFLMENCTADKITPAVADLLAHPDRQNKEQTRAMELLGRGGEPPGLRAARSVLDFMAR